MRVVRTTSLLHGYRIDQDKGTLTVIGKWPTEKTPRGFNIDPRGRFLIAAAGMDSGLHLGPRDRREHRRSQTRQAVPCWPDSASTGSAPNTEGSACRSLKRGLSVRNRKRGTTRSSPPRVLEYGGDEDLAIAALLHESVEDQGGKGTARGRPQQVR